MEDWAGFLRGLDGDGRFYRDKGIGRLLHPGTVSYREAVPENSLHILVDGDRISAHIDRFSPVGRAGDGSGAYPLWRVVVHNACAIAKELLRLLGGKRGDGRCEPSCQWVGVDDDIVAKLVGDGAQGNVSVGAVLDQLRRELSADGAEGVRRVPFNVVDQVVVLLDSQAEPWSVHLEGRVRGSLDENRLRPAVHRGLRRHPMGRARRVEPPPTTNQDYWELTRELDVDPLRVVDCADDAALDEAREELASLQVPLSQSPPVRVWLARHPDGDVVMLNAHHAATDGYGLLRLLHSVARAYTDEPDPLPDSDFLADRSLASRLTGTDRSTRMRRYLAAAERLRDLFVAPARLARDQGSDDAGYGIHPVRLDRAHTAQLTDLDHPGSVNDVLLAALHLAVAAWNDGHAAPCGRISTLVPADLRPPESREGMVGNFSLPARISTTRRQRTTPTETLAAVTAQTSRKKRTGMGTALLEVLSRTWLVPLRVKKAVADLSPVVDNRFVDTALLTNLGSVEDPPSFSGEAGGMEELWFSAPARMPLGLTVGAVTVAGRLHLTFRYRHPQFGREAARRFADCYLGELDRITEAVAGSRSNSAGAHGATGRGGRRPPASGALPR